MAIDRQEPSFGESLSEKDFLERAYQRLSRSKDWFNPVWEEGRSMWDMYAGESFSELDRQYLKETKRPVIDPPFAAGLIDTVVGAEMGQQTETVFRGVDDEFEDQVIGDWITALTRNGYALCSAHRHLMDAYKDTLVVGYGFTTTFMNVRKVPIRPQIKALNFWTVFPDPDAVEQNLEDAQYFFIESKWPLQDAQARWSSPDQRKALEGAYASADTPPASLPQTIRGTGSTTSRQGVEIYEYQYRLAQACCVYVDPETGEQKNVTREEYDSRVAELDAQNRAAEKEYQERLSAWEAIQEAQLAEIPLSYDATPSPTPQSPPPEPPQPILIDEEAVHHYNGDRFYRAFIAGRDAKTGALLENKEITEGEFTIKADTGYPWKKPKEERVRFYGMMRKVYDIQIWWSKALAGWIELLSRKIKDGGFIEKSAFESSEDAAKFVKNSSIPGMFHMLADGGIGRIKINPPVTGEPGLAELWNMLTEMFGMVSGVSRGLQGTLTQDRSNVLVSNLQEQGLQMLMPIRAPRTAFVMACGRLFAKMTLNHLPAEEIDRILGVQKVEGMTVQKQADPETGEEIEVPIPSSETGPDGQPVPLTAGRILKQADIMDYDVTVDVAVATTTQKLATWQIMNQHGMADVLAQNLPGEIWLPSFLRNAPLPGSVSKEMADKAEAYFASQKKEGTPQGVMESFQKLLQANPEEAQQLIAQLGQMAGQPAQQEQPQ